MCVHIVQALLELLKAGRNVTGPPVRPDPSALMAQTQRLSVATLKSLLCDHIIRAGGTSMKFFSRSYFNGNVLDVQKKNSKIFHMLKVSKIFFSLLFAMFWLLVYRDQISNRIRVLHVILFTGSIPTFLFMMLGNM